MNRWTSRILRNTFLMLVTALTYQGVIAGERIALVIGNNDYQQARLRNPVNDAEAVNEKLQAMGYKTTLLKNAKRLQIEDALDQYSLDAAHAEFAVFYYAGHAIQVNGRNYLIPVDARLAARRDIKKLIQLNDITEEVGQASQLGVVILDACRDNPFNAAMTETLGRGIVGRGLSGSVDIGGNTLIAYATEEDAIAADGRGRHSPYTSALLDYIAAPEVDVRLMFGKVRDAVIRKTGGRQRPFVYGSLGGSSYFLSGQPMPKPEPVAAVQASTQYIPSEQVRSISNRELGLVMDKFSDLRQAIKRKDHQAIRSLVMPSSLREQYFEYLFKNFSTIDISLSRIRAVDEKSAIIGKLTIDRLVRANGDIGVPAQAHKEIVIESRFIDNNWSPVFW